MARKTKRERDRIEFQELEQKTIPFTEHDLKRLREACTFFYSLYELLDDSGGEHVVVAAIMKPAARNFSQLVEEVADRFGDDTP